MPDQGKKSLIFPLFIFFCTVHGTKRAIQPEYQNVTLLMCSPEFINFSTVKDMGLFKVDLKYLRLFFEE